MQIIQKTAAWAETLLAWVDDAEALTRSSIFCCVRKS